ncbi:uncharacterized protein G2W53_027134 [Senna tora]|uniref:Uncharacterized protein n=1 Tax=Senna tora TaxID=362788 RepID=A0A834TIF2_9FABA|nr:uncharacterized protein G2W53_027134 [Senna tora]
MTQGSLPRSFKAIRVGRPAVDHVDRRRSKINESWEESQEVSRQSESVVWRSTTWIVVAQKSMSPRSTFFLCKISCAYAGSKRGSPSVGAAQKSITHAYHTRKPPKKVQANLSCTWPNFRWSTRWIAVGRRR